MNHNANKRLLIAVSLTTSQITLAAGFSIPDISTMGLATNNTLVANYEDVGAIPYNSAATAFHQGMSISNGLLLVAPKITAVTSTGTSDGTGVDVVAIPQFQATYTFNDKWSGGFGVTVPIGVESDWSDTGAFLKGVLHPRKSKLEVLQFSPTAAYKINPNTAISAGIDYYWIKDVDFNNDTFNIHGTGKKAGWSISALHKRGDWSFGTNYHSAVKVPISGTINLGATVGQANTSFTIPWRFQMGARYKATPKLAIEADFTRTGWNSYDTININNSLGLAISVPNNWKNNNSYRFGGTYALTNDTQLRFGYAYDKTPKTTADYNPTTPDADRHSLSFGVAQKVANDLTLEAGYMHIFFENRTITNGDGVDGTYRIKADLIGVGLSKTF